MTKEKLNPKGAFGLWSECDPNAQVAWGARGIDDSGTGFGLLPDRQGFWGEKEPLSEFLKLLNDGRLAQAQENCRRLKEGFNALELDEEEFVQWWESKLKREPELFERFARAEVLLERKFLIPSEADPRWIYQKCHREIKASQDWHDEIERQEAAGINTLPPPPTQCESADDDEWDHEEDGLLDEPCEEKFTKVPGKQDWENGYYEDSEWVCANCMYRHYLVEDDDPEYSPPPMHFRNAHSHILNEPIRMSSDKSETFVIFEDDRMIIKANTNASFGYVYVIAYPKSLSFLEETG